METLFRFLVAGLATWRLAFLIARENGPWNVFADLRQRLRAAKVAIDARCVKCCSFWLAIPFACFVRSRWPDVIVVWLGLAGLAALIDEWTRAPFEWRELDHDELLPKSEDSPQQ